MVQTVEFGYKVQIVPFLAQKELKSILVKNRCPFMGEESDCDVHSTKKKSHVKRERVIQFLSPSLLSPLESSFELLKDESSKIGTKDPRIDHSQ